MRCPQIFQCWYLAGVSAQKVRAGGSVLAGVGAALVHLLLTVASSVSHLAVAVVNVFHIQTPARVVAQMGNVDPCKHRTDGKILVVYFKIKADLQSSAWPFRRTSLSGCHLAGDTRDVTVKPRPTSLALAGVVGAALPTISSVLTGR